MKLVYCEACDGYKYQSNSCITIPYEGKYGIRTTWAMCNSCYASKCGGKEALQAALSNEAKPAHKGLLGWLISLVQPLEE